MIIQLCNTTKCGRRAVVWVKKGCGGYGRTVFQTVAACSACAGDLEVVAAIPIAFPVARA